MDWIGIIYGGKAVGCLDVVAREWQDKSKVRDRETNRQRRVKEKKNLENRV